MTKVNFKISVIALAIGMFAVSCGGGGSKKQSGSATTETKTEAKANEVYTIPKDDILVYTELGDKEAVFAEFPQELLKAVGKLDRCSIGKGYGYKYSLTIRTTGSKDGAADLVKLIDYYKSIGATVAGNNANYDVTLPNAKSVTIYGTETFFQVQFNVIKE